MSTPDLRRLWVRLAQAAGLVAFGLLALFDFAASTADDSGIGTLLLLLVPMGLAVATVPLWLPVHRLGSRRLPLAALALATASLAVTAGVVLLSGGGGILLARTWGLAESAGLIGVVFVVSRWGAPRLAPWAAVAAGLAVAAMPLRVGTGNLLVIFGLLQVLAAAGAAGVGLYLRIVAAGRERAIALVRAEQRAEFARDLHDFIAHHVTGIVVQAQGARFVAEQDPHRVIVALEQIERAGAETMASMRRMVGILRNPDAPLAPLAPLAGVTELEPLLTGFNGAANAPARLHVDGDLNGLPVEVSTSAYRVVMEGLTNARQHAPDARSVDVAVRRTPDWLLVRVADDGASPRTAPARGHGFGLIGLTERVRALGGTITAGPGVAGGWVLDAAFPLRVAVAR